MMGAAIATVAAYSTMAIAMAWWSQRIYPVPYQWRRVATAALGAVGLAAIGKGLGGGHRGGDRPDGPRTRPCSLALGFTSPGERRRLWALVGRVTMAQPIRRPVAHIAAIPARKPPIAQPERSPPGAVRAT